LTGIRDACLAPSQSESIDPLIFQYWHDYTQQVRDPEPEELLIFGDRSYDDYFDFYLIQSKHTKQLLRIIMF
jgi:hypothetical protein